MKLKKTEDGKVQFYGSCIAVLDNDKEYRIRYDKRNDTILFPLPNFSNFVAFDMENKRVERLFLK